MSGFPRRVQDHLAQVVREALELGLAGGDALAEDVVGEHRRDGDGEALVMTAAGLAVAIPAVLAYNIFGKMVAGSEAELEGFAHDLREMIIDTPAP